jgi:hypothetical protein
MSILNAASKIAKLKHVTTGEKSVLLLVRPRMAGRPRSGDAEQGTKQTRLFTDLADMIADLALVLPKSSAQITEPLLRPDIEAMHRKYKAQIEKAKAAQAAAEEALKEAREEAKSVNHLGGKKPPNRPKAG